jgi:hypothetical protein
VSHNSTQKDYAHGTLAFLNSDTFDHDIEQKSARPQLIGLLRNAFEIDLPESTPLAEVR